MELYGSGRFSINPLPASQPPAHLLCSTFAACVALSPPFLLFFLLPSHALLAETPNEPPKGRCSRPARSGLWSSSSSTTAASGRARAPSCRSRRRTRRGTSRTSTGRPFVRWSLSGGATATSSSAARARAPTPSSSTGSGGRAEEEEEEEEEEGEGEGRHRWSRRRSPRS
jgi:hypothetical protein